MIAEVRGGLYWQNIDRSAKNVFAVQQAAERALALQPGLPEAHRAMGYYWYWTQRNYARALAEFATAERTEPNNAELIAAVAYIQRRTGHWEEALAALRRAAELDPGNYERFTDLQETTWLMRLYPESERYGQHAMEMSPDQVEAIPTQVSLYVSWRGDTARAAALVRDYAERFGFQRLSEGAFNQENFILANDSILRRGIERLSASTYGSGDTASYFWASGMARRAAGHLEAARAVDDSLRVVLEHFLKDVPDDANALMWLGEVDARLGRKADAVRQGKRAAALLPPARDAYFGTVYLIRLAGIYAAVGEADLAIDQTRDRSQEPIVCLAGRAARASGLDPAPWQRAIPALARRASLARHRAWFPARYH